MKIEYMKEVGFIVFLEGIIRKLEIGRSVFFLKIFEENLFLYFFFGICLLGFDCFFFLFYLIVIKFIDYLLEVFMCLRFLSICDFIE